MTTINKAPVLLTVLLLGISCNLHAADSQEVRWNQFVKDLYSLHQHMIKDRDVYTRESNGGYGGLTNDLNFYREVKTFDKETDRLLSNIKWENKNPDNIHEIDINIYDNQGRIIRDYSAYYLPHARNAPTMTLINIHHYTNGLYSFRQFDANDEILFEFCEGTHNGRPVKIVFEYYEIPDKISDITDKSERDAYHACFHQLAKSAGTYLNPLNEIKM